MDKRSLACEGGDKALRHPRVYLALTEAGEVRCPYCGTRYVIGATLYPEDILPYTPCTNKNQTRRDNE